MASPLTRSISTSATNFDLKEKDPEDLNEFPKESPVQGPEIRTTDTSNNTIARRQTGFKWILVCIAIYSSAFLYGLDNTIVADIQSAAVEQFGEVEKLGWLGIGFPLGSIATILSIGKAFSIFDTKWIYIASLVMFAAGSALCGGSPSMNALIVGRVWAGAGGAGMVRSSILCLTEM
jgi:hypothetical protein